MYGVLLRTDSNYHNLIIITLGRLGQDATWNRNKWSRREDLIASHSSTLCLHRRRPHPPANSFNSFPCNMLSRSVQLSRWRLERYCIYDRGVGTSRLPSQNIMVPASRSRSFEGSVPIRCQMRYPLSIVVAAAIHASSETRP